MPHTRSLLLRRLARVATCLLFVACAPGEEAEFPAQETEAAVAEGSAFSQAEVPGVAPVLAPTYSFALADDIRVAGVTISPDGSRVVVTTQERLGTPVFLRSYDVSTGEVVATAEFSGIGLYQLHWMADNRLVAADRENRLGWRSWDGTTLEELRTLPQDPTCADGSPDRNTGAIYSSDGMVGMSDVLCRFDTGDGSIRRTGAGVLVGAERFWVRAGSAEVVVLHSPEPDVSLELVVLDGASLTPRSSTTVEFGETVEAVAATAWISNTSTSPNSARLEPGGIPVPYMGPLRPSGAGLFFVYANGSDGVTFVSATDGRLIGTMPAGMNIAAFADWSIDDSWFARLTMDRTIEVYRF